MSRGFSLVELMVALVIGLIVSLGAFQLFITSKNNFGQAQAVMMRQDALRYLVDSISYDIRSASSINISSTNDKISLQHVGKPDNTICPGSNDYRLEYSRVGDSIVMERWCDAASSDSSAESIVFGFGDIRFAYTQPFNVGVEVEIDMIDGTARLSDETYALVVANRGNVGVTIGKVYGFAGDDSEDGADGADGEGGTDGSGV